MTSRRYLLVIDSLQCGGAERHAADLAGALVARGHDVTIACSSAGHFASQAEADGVRVAQVCDRLAKRRYSRGFARGVRELLAREGFDLVHGHLYAGGLAAAAAVAGRGTPLLLTEQTEAPWRSGLQASASRLAYRRATRVIGVSRAITLNLERRFGVPAAKLRCIPNGVAMNGPPKRPPTLHPPAPTIGLVARLQPEKDVPTFLRCAALVASRFPDSRFLVAGDGPLRAELEAHARELGLESRVRFLGVLQDMSPFFGSIDILACSSIAEGTPLAIAEAMGAGIPVVATAVGGIPDQITDGHDGFLVEPRRPEALAARIGSLLDGRVDSRRISQAAYRRAAAEFSLDAMFARTEAVYEEALDGWPRHRHTASTTLERVVSPESA